MKQVPSNKYTIAWFKIAECVSRGEKERALGVYRLLSYSLDDPALVNQLEGDIFLAFDDRSYAVSCYYQAAQLYRKGNRLLEAAAVYEHLLTIQPENREFRTAVINLYKQLDIQSKVEEHLMVFVNYLLQKKQFNEIKQMTQEVVAPIRIAVRQQAFFALLQLDESPHDIVVKTMQMVIDELLVINEEPMLQQFLATLETVNKSYYKQACDYKDKQ